MAHVEIIIQQTILPHQDAHPLSAVHSGSGMKAEIRYTPADSETTKQIGDQVEKIVKHLAKLADRPTDGS